MRKETVWYIVPLDEIIITHRDYGQFYATPASYEFDLGNGMQTIPNNFGLIRYRIIESGWINSIEIGHLIKLGIL